jgi:hypothetical protein
VDDVTLRNGEFPRRLAGGRRLALLCFRLLPQRCDERLILVNQSIFKLTENLKSYLVALFAPGPSRDPGACGGCAIVRYRTGERCRGLR